MISVSPESVPQPERGSEAVRSAEKQDPTLTRVEELHEERLRTAEAVSATPEKQFGFKADLKALQEEFHLPDRGNEKQNFSAVSECLAKEDEKISGVPWQVTWAQSILESGWGTSGLTRDHLACFGIKAGADYAGDRVRVPTKEQDKEGHSSTILADFRVYPSLRASFRDHGAYLKASFPWAFEFKNNPLLFLAALKSHPDHMYATAVNYVDTIRRLWDAQHIDLPASSPATATSGDGQNPPEGLFAQLGRDLKHFGTKIADFFKSLFVSWGFTVGTETKTQTTVSEKPKEPTLPAPLPRELGSEWNDKLEAPDAQAVCFSKGVHGRVSSTFGLRANPFDADELDDHSHAGIDIAAPEGTTVYATHSGQIVEPRSGSTLTLRTSNGSEYTLRHLSKNLCKLGDTIKAGQALGEVGNVGRSTGPHLHLELRYGGQLFDPKESLGAAYRAEVVAKADEQQKQVEDIRGKSANA